MNHFLLSKRHWRLFWMYFNEILWTKTFLVFFYYKISCDKWPCLFCCLFPQTSNQTFFRIVPKTSKGLCFLFNIFLPPQSVLPDLATSSEFGYFSCLILTKFWLWLLSKFATFLAIFQCCQFWCNSTNLVYFRDQLCWKIW